MSKIISQSESVIELKMSSEVKSVKKALIYIGKKLQYFPNSYLQLIWKGGPLKLLFQSQGSKVRAVRYHS